MRSATALLLLGALLVPAPVAHATAGPTATSTAGHATDAAHTIVDAHRTAGPPVAAVTGPQAEVRAATSGGRSRGGYHGGTSCSDGDGSFSPWSLWLSVGLLCAVVTWWVVSVRRRRNRGDDSD